MYSNIVENKLNNIEREIPDVVLRNIGESNKQKHEKDQRIKSYAFLMYAISQICDLDILETPAFITDGYNDAQIDAIFINDDDVLQIHFFQTKYFSKSDKQIGENDIRLTLDSIRKILDGKNPSKQMSPTLKEKIQEIKEAIRDRGYPEIYVHFVSNGIKSELPEQLSENYKDFEINCYGSYELVSFSVAPKKRDIECEIRTIGDITQNFISGISGYIATVSAKEFIAVYRKAGERNMLEKNIRYYKGLNAINKKIKESAESEVDSQFFWFINNGISLVCENFSPPKGDGNGNKILKMKNPMIINGGQTTVTLANADIHDNARVLLKIYDLSDDEIIAKITEGTNSQNPISLRDLKSNHPIQKFIQEYFKDRNVLLEVKVGEFDKGNTKNTEIVKNDFLIQSYVAIYEANPGEARSKTSALRRYFDKIFESKDKQIASKLFRSYELVKFVSKEKKDESFYSHAMFSICYGMTRVYDELLDPSKILELKILNSVFEKTLHIIEEIIKTKQEELREDYSHNYLFKSKEIKSLIDQRTKDR